MMEVSFNTKAESKQQQEEAFLKLSKAERMRIFFRLCYWANRLPTKHRRDTSNNFEIVIEIEK